MPAVDLLQEVGLTKYEAEAYAALLAEGPLTGYELGKRSAVPLSRSYEILEKLTQRGLALAQPGDPPRYAAESPDRFVARLRADTTTTIDALTAALAGLARSTDVGDFWVVRGRARILARAQAVVAGARQIVDLRLPERAERELARTLDEARRRGCRCTVHPAAGVTSPNGDLIFLLADQSEAIVGVLDPADRCQAVVGGHPSLVAVLDAYFALPFQRAPRPATEPLPPDAPLHWVAWEDQKQERLRRLSVSDRVA